MICPFCHDNEATIHYTEVINGKITKVDICEKCAKIKGIDVSLPFSFSDVLTALSSALSGENTAYAQAQAILPKGPTCDVCGVTLKDIVSQGRLGCAKCYEIFQEQIEQIVKTIQKAPTHNGKIPAQLMPTVTSARRLRTLEEELKKAVQEERYEECVTLRDEIRQLKDARPSTPNAKEDDTHE